MMQRRTRQIERRVAVLAVTAALILAVTPASAGGGGEAGRKQIAVEITASELPERIEQDFGDVTAGEILVLDIVVHNDSDAPLEIARAVSQCACMEAEAKDREVAPGEVGHIVLTLDSDEYSGPVRESALVLWQDRPIAVTTIELVTNVKPLVEVLPRRIVRFSVDNGAGGSAEVELRSPDGTPFSITSLESSKPYLKATALGEGAGHKVTIELAEDAPAGMLRESITIATDLPGNPKVELNITGVVRKPKAE